ncbi:probable 28S ribosomal protein S16, mitochondrial [Folsomia candida]|uniref:Small ribosomal subunit protein bS16m n=1 Tax=Folsomia candida TaxID=158441 RepID=A0A226F324_FOLCA|nr:probable 28S ribosomal protein S16, mitochondrial [Folsomia candida]OXA63888.1 hypothetical protein Fcan01_02610 [Folsomia candida]
MPLPAVGGAALLADKGPKIIRLALHGHANRPFFHIVLTNCKVKRDDLPVEQLGTYDPMPNLENQKLLSLNVERTRYWMGQGAIFSTPIAKLLGQVGFLDIHPQTYIDAWRTRFDDARIEAETKKATESTTNVETVPATS